MRPIRTRSPLTLPGALTWKLDVTEALSAIGLGTSTDANGRSGPGEPVGTVNGTVLVPWSVCRCTAKSRLTPQSAPDASAAVNGVALAAGTPKVRSGHGDVPWVTSTPGVLVVRSPVTPVRAGSEVCSDSSSENVSPGPTSPSPPGEV